MNYFWTSGYYISCAWISSARKYFQFEKKGSNASKAATISFAKRRTSRLLGIPLPSNNINADITCTHGQMYSDAEIKNSPSKVVRKTKTVICGEYWFLLRRYFPLGATFKCSKTVECSLCIEQSIQCKALHDNKLESAQKQRKLSVVNEELQDLFMRRTGLPSHCVQDRIAQLESVARVTDVGVAGVPSGSNSSSVEAAAAAAAVAWHSGGGDTVAGLRGSSSSSHPWQPLTPGLYNIIPREWLRYWRKYARDVTIPTGCLSAVDFAGLFCEKHRRLLLPMHLVEYLMCLRKALLGGGVGENEENNVVVEIITAEEWDAIVSMRLSDSSVGPSFALDGQDITWNSPVCDECMLYSTH